MIFPETWVEWLAGAVLLALCSVWLRRQLRPSWTLASLLGLWWAAWAVTIGICWVSLVRADDALSDVPPDQRLSQFARWVNTSEDGRLANRLIVAVGCLVVLGVWLRRRGRSDRGV